MACENEVEKNIAQRDAGTCTETFSKHAGEHAKVKTQKKAHIRYGFKKQCRGFHRNYKKYGLVRFEPMS